MIRHGEWNGPAINSGNRYEMDHNIKFHQIYIQSFMTKRASFDVCTK